MTGLVARALALHTARSFESNHDREEEAIPLATVLAFADPAASWPASPRRTSSLAGS